MKVLIVEDDDLKRKHIETYLLALDCSHVVLSAYSVKSAIRMIDQQGPELILLDMSLPTFDVGDSEDGGRPQAMGGVEIVRYLVFSDIQCPIILVTGYEAFPKGLGDGHVDLTELRQQLYEEFGEIVVGVVHYNPAHDEWKTNLSQLLDNCRNGDGE